VNLELKQLTIAHDAAHATILELRRVNPVTGNTREITKLRKDNAELREDISKRL